MSVARSSAPEAGTSPADGTWRPVGFFLCMLGFGLRLDSPWQGLATLVILAGLVLGGAGLWPLARRAFVLPEARR